jgi:hypothetical protein
MHRRQRSRHTSRAAHAALALLLLGGLTLVLLSLAPLAGASSRSVIFDAFAAPSWTVTLSGFGAQYDSGVDVVTYGKNVVFVAGTQANAAGTYYDISLTRYRGSVEQWTRTYDGPAHRSDEASCMALSPDGKAVYVAGTSQYAAGDDVVLIKRATKNGKLLWARRYDGAHFHDEARAIAVDPSGNVTVVGATDRSLADVDALAVSWRADGRRRFARHIDGGAHGFDVAFDVVAAADGTVFLVGETTRTDGVSAALTARLSARGKKLWLKKYAGPAGTYAVATSIAARPGGGFYVGGTCTQAATGTDGLVLRYTKKGRRTLFAVDTGAGGTTSQMLSDVAVASTGAVVAVGRSFAGGGAPGDCHAVAWRANGALIGAPSIGGPFSDGLYGVATDAFGGYYAVGYLGVAAGDQKIVVTRGSVLSGGGGFASVWGGPVASLANMATAVAVRDVSAYVVGGYDSGGPTGIDQVLLAYIY